MMGAQIFKYTKNHLNYFNKLSYKVYEVYDNQYIFILKTIGGQVVTAA